MKDFQQKVVDEKEELDAKTERLLSFINGEVFDALPVDERKRMSEQYYHMGQYSTILGKRIENFGVSQ